MPLTQISHEEKICIQGIFKYTNIHSYNVLNCEDKCFTQMGKNSNEPHLVTTPVGYSASPNRLYMNNLGISLKCRFWWSWLRVLSEIWTFSNKLPGSPLKCSQIILGVTKVETIESKKKKISISPSASM